MKCSMCGFEFEATELNCHPACPLGAACMVICCPRCGYSTINPDRSALATLIQRIVRQVKPAPPGEPRGNVSLAEMEPGQEGVVIDTQAGPEHAERLLHLGQYGLLPGATVSLYQKRPALIVRIGETELALDGAIAAGITVAIERG